MSGMARHISKHGSGAITRFDIVGSFFVNLFYNELFKKANSIKQQVLDKSTTDIYKELLTSYSEFTERDEFFKQSVKGIHSYVISNTNQIDMTHKECIDFIVKELVPARIYQSLRDAHKNKLFHETMSAIVKEFASRVIMKYLRVIIDQRGNSENVTILQNEFLDIICVEKDKVYSKFISGNSTTISIELHKQKVRTLENEISKKSKTIESLSSVNAKAADVIKQLQRKVVELQTSKTRTTQENHIMQASREVRLEAPVKVKIVEPILQVEPTQSVHSEPIPTVLESSPRNISEERDETGSLLFDVSDEYY
jgi:uncharacterized coiled-coil protein SlyX